MNHLLPAKRAIRVFIRAHWPDQKLAEVYAFNRDGKMSYLDSCCCILGVTLADTLHNSAGKGRLLANSELVEYSYLVLTFRRFPSNVEKSNALAQRRLSAILRAEMRRRDKLRQAAVRRTEPLDVISAHPTEQSRLQLV